MTDTGLRAPDAREIQDFLDDAAGGYDPHDIGGFGCAYLDLGSCGGLRWAVAVGIGSEDGMPHAKLAFQSVRSVMQCDFDVDWLMPYDDDGDVWDTDDSVGRTSGDWFAEQWRRMVAGHVPDRMAVRVAADRA